MKKIYEFTINKTEKVKESVSTKNDKGEEIEQIKTVDKPVPHHYFIKRAGASLIDDAEIFRAMTESEYIKKGIITIPLLEKRVLNEGNIYTEKQSKRIEELKEIFPKKQIELEELNLIAEVDRTEEQKKKLEDLSEEIVDLINEFDELKNISEGIYNRTAEVLARNRTLLYLTLFLSYEDKDGKFVPVFGEGTFEERFKKYEELEERQDEYEYNLFKKLNLIVGSWYFGRASTKEEFDNIILVQEASGLLKK